MFFAYFPPSKRPHSQDNFFLICCPTHLRDLGPVVQRLDNAIQRISVNKTNHAIRWIVIYPVDSIIQPFNNRGLVLADLRRRNINFCVANSVNKMIPGHGKAYISLSDGIRAANEIVAENVHLR